MLSSFRNYGEKNCCCILAMQFMLLFFIISDSFAAPPIFDPVGEERMLNSNLFVVEGEEITFTISAQDPDGDNLTYSALNMPDWADFDTSTGIFSGTAPMWSDDYETRKTQNNVYDITFQVSDGTYTVEKIVSVYVLDADWTEKSVAELVANRPIKAGGETGTPVQVENVTEETIHSDYGGGKTLRKISFSFTSQVPDIEGWEDDWVSTTNYIFLPTGEPAIMNAGAIVEGGYSQNFGETELAERACAELDMPVMIIDRGWEFTHAGDLMEKYDDLAVQQRSPEYLFYTFTTAHYLRSIDAFVTVLNQQTDWQISYTDFKVIFTGHSKMGHSCHNVAAADPDRVTGFMANGSTVIDTGASRILGDIQHALGTKPEAFRNYRAVMMRYYFESLKIESQMSPDVQALIIQGTDDDKNRDTGYTPKYIMLTADEQMAIPHTIACLANAPHSTQTPLHSTYWVEWLAHSFLSRPVGQVASVYHYFQDDTLYVEAAISGETTVNEVVVWASGQNDLDTSNWDTFVEYPMALYGTVYRAEIPVSSKSYFVEARDEADGIRGLATSPPVPVDRDYPVLPLAPRGVKGVQIQADSSGIVLNWTNPADADFIGTMIRYSQDTPVSTPLDGSVLYDGTDMVSDLTNSFVDAVYYSAFCYDALGNYSSGSDSGTLLAALGVGDPYERSSVEVEVPSGGRLTVLSPELPDGYALYVGLVADDMLFILTDTNSAYMFDGTLNTFNPDAPVLFDVTFPEGRYSLYTYFVPQGSDPLAMPQGSGLYLTDITIR